MPLKKPIQPPQPNMVRTIPKSFAWIDHRLREYQYLRDFSPPEIALYFFLILAADDKGLSCWRLDVVERTMPVFHVPQLRSARESLLRKHLIAFKPWRNGDPDGVSQILPINVPPQINSDYQTVIANILKSVS